MKRDVAKERRKKEMCGIRMKKDEEGCGKGKKKDGGVWNMNAER